MDSMRLMVTKCNPSLNANCKSDAKISEFLAKTQFRMRLYEDQTYFSYKNTQKFHKCDYKETVQMFLSLDKHSIFEYKVGIAKVFDKSSRYNPFETPRSHSYVKSQAAGQMIFQKEFFNHVLQRTPKSKPLMVPNLQLLFTFDFIEDSKVHYDMRTYANSLDMLSFVGGLNIFMFVSIGFVSQFFTLRTIYGKFIRTLYFLNQSNVAVSTMAKTRNFIQTKQLKPVKIGFITYISELKFLVHSCLAGVCKCCCKKVKPGQDVRLFRRGVTKLNQDLNIMALVEIIHKLKVSLEVMLGRDQKLLHKIQYLYYQRVSINPDTSEDEMPEGMGSTGQPSVKFSNPEENRKIILEEDISKFFDRNEKTSMKLFTKQQKVQYKQLLFDSIR